MSGTVENDGLITVSPTSSLGLTDFTNNGRLTIDGTASVSGANEAVNKGTVTVNGDGVARFSSGYVQNGRNANTTVNGIMNISKGVNPAMGILNGGTVNGTGTINGGAVNRGIVAPGNPKGM